MVLKTGDKIALWGLATAVVTGLISVAAWQYPHSDPKPAAGTQQPGGPIAIDRTPTGALSEMPTATAGEAPSSTDFAETDPPTFVKDLVVPLTNYTSLSLSTAKIEESRGAADLYYDAPAGGKPRIRDGMGGRTSILIEDPTRQGCQDAVDTRPNTKPITSLKKATRICVTVYDGVALLEVTSAPDADGDLGLRLTYWED
ncbi:hypothetical protein [Actinoplanes sp. HUAS TT8]|uniref:hypothetical protein n=1 Tax=Actinoplanes sp. HUAS TT8 TaxID=3447453 RepID=UPI003F524AFA